MVKKRSPKDVPHRRLSTRSQVLRSAADDAHAWALQSDAEVFTDLRERLDGRSPTAQRYAAALRRYDSPMVESPASFAGVPARWRDLYDSTLERVYRADIRARVKEIEAGTRSNPSWGNVRSAASKAHAAASRAYHRAKPHAKRAAASAKSAAERGYAYAKPRVKAGTRRVLSGISTLSARGAKALENPLPSGVETRYVVLFRDGDTGKLSWAIVWARDNASARRSFATAFGRHHQVTMAYPGDASKQKTGPRSVLGRKFKGESGSLGGARENPAGNVNVWEVFHDGPGAGAAGDGTHISRFRSEASARSFARGKTLYRNGPATVTKVSVPRRLAERWGLA